MSRRARPTLRVLREDLDSGWENPFARRALERGDVEAVQPLTSLPHPILRKAAESFGDDPSQDTYVTSISSVSSHSLLEIKQGQWRAGVWIDDEACWVVSAGLAKGDHQDRDDFYEKLSRIEKGGGVRTLLPDHEDRALLKKERAGALIASWQITVQNLLIDALAKVCDGGRTQIDLPFPVPSPASSDVFASVDVEVTITDEVDYSYEDVVVEITTDERWRGTDLWWHLAMHTLATINPPEQGWDSAGGSFSNLLEPGTLKNRLAELRHLTEHGELAQTLPSSTAHYTHRRNLAERTVTGEAVQALCGVYFVPRQDAEPLSRCPKCAALLAEFPEA